MWIQNYFYKNFANVILIQNFKLFMMQNKEASQVLRFKLICCLWKLNRKTPKQQFWNMILFQFPNEKKTNNKITQMQNFHLHRMYNIICLMS